MGTFAALIFPTTLSIISNTFRERRERAAALGVWGAVVGVGVAAGPVTGGVLLEHFYWGSVFWALVPLALVTAAAAYFARARVARPVGARRSTCPGLVLSVAMLGALTYTIIEAPEPRLGVAARPSAASPLSAVLLRGLRARASAAPPTRCSTSPCSGTAGSAPRAAR